MAVRTVWLCVGLPGAGKSSWARRKVRERRVVAVCRDDIRTMLLGRYGVVEAVEPLVERLAFVAVRSALRKGFDVVVDETNITRVGRERWVRWVKRSIPRVRTIAVWFPEMVRNVEWRMRDPKGLPRREWEAVVRRMRGLFEPPSPAEGFDRVMVVRSRR